MRITFPQKLYVKYRTKYICGMATEANTSYPKEKIRILFLENISDVAVKIFRQQGYELVDKINKALTEEELINEIREVHILGIRSKTQITRNVLEAAKKTPGNRLLLHRCQPGRSERSNSERSGRFQCTLFKHEVCCRISDWRFDHADSPYP